MDGWQHNIEGASLISKHPEYYTKVSGNANLVRDERSHAILNVNFSAYEAHQKQKQRQKEIDATMNEVNDLKIRLTNIENLLAKVLDKLP